MDNNKITEKKTAEKKELAEKAAGYLGWSYNERGRMKMWLGPTLNDGTPMLVDDACIEGVIFSWPTADLMNKKMESLGWRINWCYGFVSFEKNNLTSLVRSNRYECFGDKTYNGITLAFCEAMAIISIRENGKPEQREEACIKDLGKDEVVKH